MANCERCIRRCGSRGQPVTIDCDRFTTKQSKAEEFAKALTAHSKICQKDISLLSIKVRPTSNPGYEFKISYIDEDGNLRWSKVIQDELYNELIRIVSDHY